MSWLEGHMVVTVLTASPRMALLDDVTELAPLYHILSKVFGGKKDGHAFKTGDVGWGCYYDDNLEILKLERLHRDCHSK